MEKSSPQVTIIGSGLAGVMAALGAKEKGAHVTLISGAPGATALASGAWDVAEPVGDIAPYTWDLYPDVTSCIEQIVRAQPQHPYTLLSQNGGAQKVSSLLEEAFGVLYRQMPYQPKIDFKQQQVLLTPLGTVKFTAIADPAQAAGNLRSFVRGRLLILGIPGLATSPVGLAQTVFKEVRKSAGVRDWPEIVSDSLEIEGIPQHSLSPFALAQRLEEEASFNACVKAIRALVRQHHASHVLLPPVIGVENNPSLMERLHSECGAVCAETLATVPSVPGLRRHRALEQVLKRAGIGIMQDKIIGFRSRSNRITQLILANQGEEAPLEVGEVVLCSGRFLSGGLSSNGAVRETIFNLPVFAGGKQVGSTFIGKLVHRRYLSDHSIFAAGVKFNSQLQALNNWDEPLFANLRVAGSVLSGYNAAAGGCGSGVATLSGWLAGAWAAS